MGMLLKTVKWVLANPIQAWRAVHAAANPKPPEVTKSKSDETLSWIMAAAAKRKAYQDTTHMN